MSHKRLTQLALLGLLTVAMARPAAVQTDVPPRTIPYQGYLATDAGAVEGEVDIGVALFADGDPSDDEEALWSEAFVDVAVAGGLFRLSLGTAEPIPIEVLLQGPLYVEVTVDGEALSPRLPIDSVPYARVVEHSRRTDNEGGLFIADRSVIDADGGWLGSTLTLDGLGCDSEQIPVSDGETWSCQSLTEGGAPLALAAQSCDEGDLISGIDASGLPVCADGGALVTYAFLDENGFVTAGDIEAQGVLSQTNRPTLGAFDNVPGSLADGVDNNTQFSGTAPVVVNGTTISLSGNGCDAGEVLGFDGSDFECRPAPRLSCEPRDAVNSAPCQGSEVLVGGGFELADSGDGALWITATARPSGNSFACGLSTTGGGSSNTCYAICCTYQ